MEAELCKRRDPYKNLPKTELKSIPPSARLKQHR